VEAVAKPEAILATNTSSLKLADIAAQFKDPARLVGIHFFNPVPQLQLVEVVAGEHTHTDMAQKAAAFVRQIDKLPLPVKDSPGFLVNRVLGPYMQNAFRMLDEGVKPETLDAAMEAFGMPMGPIELADTVGLDICLAAGKELAKAGAQAPQVLLDRVALGQLGKKSGQGIYRYENGKAVKGAPAAFEPSLVEALIEPYLNEAQAVLAEGIVADADLIDGGLIFGTGFAPFRGGPLHYLESLKQVVGRASHQPPDLEVARGQAPGFARRADAGRRQPQRRHLRRLDHGAGGCRGRHRRGARGARAAWPRCR
jgi:3-hydroxyacyl-CoA dehydrogenase / enoyl-CoA hydratase / 3-hydroxybutyryl-CoA epimerase